MYQFEIFTILGGYPLLGYKEISIHYITANKYMQILTELLKDWTSNFWLTLKLFIDELLKVNITITCKIFKIL